jgi:hypothetical protein
MAKKANPGEMRTKVTFFKMQKSTNDNGIVVESEVNIFGDGKFVFGKWVNAHGAEVFRAMELELKDPVTLTTRYSPLYTPDLIAYHGTDPAPYEVISIDNVEDGKKWVEMKLQRRVKAR